MQLRRNIKKPLLVAMLFAVLMPTLSACYVYDYDRDSYRGRYYYRDRDYTSRRDGYWWRDRYGRYHYRDRDDNYWRDRYGRYGYRDRNYWRYDYRYRDPDYWYDRRYSSYDRRHNWPYRDRNDD